MAKVLISMPDEFLSDIDGVAERESRSRSELIREALRSYVRQVSRRVTPKATKNAEILEELLG